MDIFQISKKGGREINEDSIGVFFSDDKKKIYLICADGLGGHGKGEEASAIAVACVEELAKASKEAKTFFEEFFKETERRIQKRQRDEGTPNDFKTTSVVAVIDGEKFRCAHIGDSRLYYFREGKILFRTLDHSVPQMLVLAGEL